MSSRKVDALPQRQARQITRKYIANPSKGLNNLVSPSLIDDREFSQSQNMEYDEGGVARKRNGYTSVTAALTAAKGLGSFVTETYRHIVSIDNGVFNYSTGSSWTPVATVSFTASAQNSFTQARDIFYVWNGVEGGATWDGATLARPGTMPKAKFALFYNDVHIAAGVAGQPNRLYISNTADASDFTNAATTLNNSTEVPGATVFSGTGAQFIDVRKNDGDKITGLGRFQDVVIVFKERSVYQLSFDDTGNPTISAITGSTGCVSHKTIENVENDLYFLSREGVRVLGNEPNFFTSIRTNLLSIRIQTEIDSINNEYFEKCNAHYFDNKYILSVPTTSSSIARTFVYDRRFQAWSVWTNFNANAYIKFVDTTNTEFLYFLDDGGIQCYKVTPGTFNDNGSAIEAFLVSKAFDLNAPDITKYFTDLGFIFRRITGQIDISVYLDGGVELGTTTLSQGAVDGMGLIPLGMQILGLGTQETSDTIIFSDAPERVIVNSNSRTIKFKLYNNRINENFVLLGYILAYYPFSHFFFDSSRKLYL